MARVSFPTTKTRFDEGDSLKDFGGATVPADVQNQLEKGPKFCYEPNSSRPQLLAMVRHLGGLVAEEDKARAIGDGVECLLRTASAQRAKPPHKKIVAT
ncbi:hypothetical protein HPB50_009939 [Hyalomma asiaticum]|uniref:Uncharacterized protein n=1 Tax=Hyalomma asiaticum TaxID=266040 RepID=A0ACB7SGF9_HYAAI|nr:hypothetical protein HPB50_009939 [Hyalomma asiaticum]